MRREHLDRLQPVCPTCRAAGRTARTLTLGPVLRCAEHDSDAIQEGVLLCPEPLCQREHPIIDGIPIVVADFQSWATHQLDAVLWRTDLSPFTESLLGDAAGPGHVLERERTTLSAYGRVHWGDFDRDETLPRAAGLAALLDTLLEMLDQPPRGMWIDLGCAVGRATRDIALRTGDLAVGVDLSFGMLRMAERCRAEGIASFPLRRIGLVYDRRTVHVPDMPAHDMSFWCCDVDNLPFPDSIFAGALSLNVLDCVPSPLQHLLEMARVLSAGGSGLLCTPYDWSAVATPLTQWLGGHSQRGVAHGSSMAEVRRVIGMLDTPLEIVCERDRIPWRVYINERAAMDYAVHALHLRR